MLHKRSRGPELSEPTLPGTRQFQNCHHHGEPGGGAVGQRNPASLSRRQVSGPWSGVPGAVSPCRAPTNTAHRAGAQGRSTKAGQVVPLKKSTQTNKETTEAPARACAAGGGAQGLHSSPTTGWRASGTERREWTRMGGAPPSGPCSGLPQSPVCSAPFPGCRFVQQSAQLAQCAQ